LISTAALSQSEASPVLFAGCLEVLAGPVCVRAADRPLVFWIAASNAGDVVVEVDRERAAPELVEVGGGFRFTLDVLGARHIFVRSEDGRSFLSLSLAILEHNADVEAAEKLRQNEKTLPEARARAYAALSTGSPISQARAKSLLARIERRAGDHRVAVLWFEAAIRAHRELHCISGQYRDLTALAHLSIYRLRDFRRAQSALVRATALSRDDTEQTILLPYYQALFSVETGRLGAAVMFLEAAELGAARLDLAQQVHDVRMANLDALSLLGRHEEARALLKRVASADLQALEAYKRAEVMNNLAWWALVVDDQTISPLALATAAEEIYRENDPLNASIALATIAMAQFRAGELDAAERSLGRAEQLSPSIDALNATERIELRARLAMARGDHSAALERYSELTRLAADAALPFVRWRALLGEAATLEAMHRDRDAVSRYDAADQLFRELLALIPLGDGRDDFAKRHEEASARHVGLWVRLGDAERALAVARLARVRSLGLLDIANRVDRMSEKEGAAWIAALNEYKNARAMLDEILIEEQEVREARLKLPADQLRVFLAAHKNLSERGDQARRVLKRAFAQALVAVGDDRAPPGIHDQLAGGDLLLVYHPIPEGWVGIARTAKTTRMEILPDATAPLAPFFAELEQASRVIVMPSGALVDVNFHAIEVGGKPLGLRVKVSYGIDVESRSPALRASRPVADENGLALVVAVDPTRSLKSIEREARAVGEILTAQGRKVVLVFGEDATRAELTKWLADPRVTHFHFAGHAVSGGRDGLESRLLLADGSLTGTDILALGRAPSDVVISACEAGKSSARGGILGLGLAQAFILAGARRVVASSAPAEDTRTFEMMKAAYASGSAVDAGAVFKAAFEAGKGGRDWDSFRVVEAW
jgi:tetratricopeptide (TPR) repeat protein